MSGSDFLAEMAERSRERLAEARKLVPDGAMLSRALNSRAPPRLVLSEQGFDVIAEVKLRSPATGVLHTLEEGETENVAQRAVVYAQAGAAAVSVLTEPSRFDGSMEHLNQVTVGLRQTVPAMRKDFLVHPYQVYEARVAGAGGVLVILRMLARREVQVLIEEAAGVGLFVLLEAFDEADIVFMHELVADYGVRANLLVGVNSRDLVTLNVVPGRLEQWVNELPASVPRVAESGIARAVDAALMAAAGYDVALIGSALMTAAEPAVILRSLLEAGRAARGGKPRPKG